MLKKFIDPKPALISALSWGRAREWEGKYLKTRSAFSSLIGKEIGNLMLNKDINRKFGTFLYAGTNVGDDVQTIAQLGFLPLGQNILALERDKLDGYMGKKRIMLMNGWFTHLPERWPPGQGVDPVFVSFHIANEKIAQKCYADYYKKYEPIGCRDQATANKLNQLGVDAYFSGCLTLTLNNPYSEKERGDYVVVADAHLEHNNRYPPSAPDLLKRLVPSSILDNAIYVEQEVGLKYTLNYSHKTLRALELLDLYARAKLVVTTRLHCALPCLAMGTPVIFLHKSWETDTRFEGYKDVINGYGFDAHSADIDWESPLPTDISHLRDRLIMDVKSRLLRKIGA